MYVEGPFQSRRRCGGLDSLSEFTNVDGPDPPKRRQCVANERPEMTQNMAQEVAPNMTQEMAQNIAQEMAQKMTQEMAQNMMKP